MHLEKGTPEGVPVMEENLVHVLVVGGFFVPCQHPQGLPFLGVCGLCLDVVYNLILLPVSGEPSLRILRLSMLCTSWSLSFVLTT